VVRIERCDIRGQGKQTSTVYHLQWKKLDSPIKTRHELYHGEAKPGIDCAICSLPSTTGDLNNIDFVSK